MRPPLLLVALAALAVGCSAQPERDWMRVDNSNYTAADFRRDFAGCTQKGKLDDTCMRDRGWVTVRPQYEPPPPPDRSNAPPGSVNAPPR